MDPIESIERDDKMRDLVEQVIRLTEEELLGRLERIRESAEGVAVSKEFGVAEAKKHFTQSLEHQQAELELFVKRLRTLDELRKRSWLERFQAWTGPAGLVIVIVKILFDLLK